MPLRRVTLFTRKGCHLCEAVHATIERVRNGRRFEFELVDIDEPSHERWLDAYDHDVPVVHIDGTEFARHRLDEEALLSAL